MYFVGKTPVLKSKAYADASVDTGGSETVFEIVIIKQILDRSKHTQVEFVLIHRKRVSRRKIKPAVSFETVNVRVEKRVAKDRC